jgi:NAD(P)-dependent dehydrogenase (short-subunit alcohol dehydrogenase family)
MGRFDGAMVVVTGVGHAGQVGEAVCRAFAAEGATLALLDRDKNAVAERAAALNTSGTRASAYACDLTDPAQVADVAKRVAAASQAAGSRPAGRIDALVNVAGGFAMSGAIGESDVAMLTTQLSVNVVTAYVASRAFVPLVRDGGSVVYFASAAVLPGGAAANMSAYAAAKAGVLGLMRSVADEGRSRGLRVNAVAPTVIRTAVNLKFLSANAPYV